MLKNLLLVAAGGALGSVLRYLAAVVVPKIGAGFPLATLVVNCIGSLLIGYLAGKIPTDDVQLRLLLMTGLCGGFTTFSAFSLENLELLQAGGYLPAAANILLSVVSGVGAAFVGYYLSVIG